MSNSTKTASEIESRVSSAKRDAVIVLAHQDSTQHREDLLSAVKNGIDSANSLKVRSYRNDGRETLFF